jgi:hypothetical protein
MLDVQHANSKITLASSSNILSKEVAFTISSLKT